MRIKPIETQYKGYRFRSRLEARWAVFFDTCGLVWEYEKEGFELPSGRYLPDFWLSNPHPEWPLAGYWIDIKPFHCSEKEMIRTCRLMVELTKATKHTSHILFGDPGNFYRMTYTKDSKQWSKRNQSDFDFVSEHDRPAMMAAAMVYGFGPYAYRANAEQAIVAARSARFGERLTLSRREGNYHNEFDEFGGNEF